MIKYNIVVGVDIPRPLRGIYNNTISTSIMGNMYIYFFLSDLMIFKLLMPVCDSAGVYYVVTYVILNNDARP